MNRKSILIVLSILIGSLCFGQTTKTDSLPQNYNSSIIYGSLGTAPIYVNFICNYEILFAEQQHKKFSTRGLRIGVGPWELWEDKGWTFVLSYMMLKGQNSNHLEFGIGITYWQYLTTKGFYVLPAPNIGYRYQKPNGRFVFRTGLGIPEGLYAGLGYVLF